jgi:Asp-tRNA(Asn)/Glu-tRNA(Gln) amidotransferase A subunit family amidase
MVTVSLARIAMLDQEIGAFTWLNPNAVAEAQELSCELAAGPCRGPLHGIPVAVKELFDVRDAPRTGFFQRIWAREAGSEIVHAIVSI